MAYQSPPNPKDISEDHPRFQSVAQTRRINLSSGIWSQDFEQDSDSSGSPEETISDSDFAEETSEEDGGNLEELELRFATLVSATVLEAERFLDDPRIFIKREESLERKVNSLGVQTEEPQELEELKRRLVEGMATLEEESRSRLRCLEGIEAVDKVVELKKGNLEEFPEFLEAFSLKELQRLIQIYFEKVVELKYCLGELEEDKGQGLEAQEELGKLLEDKRKEGKVREERYRLRILEFLKQNKKEPSLYAKFKRKEEQIEKVKRRQEDLERSLSALLIRHGYLVDGVDWDVKQVVRTLGIEGQLGEGTRGEMGRRRRGAISEAGSKGEGGGSKKKGKCVQLL